MMIETSQETIRRTMTYNSNITMNEEQRFALYSIENLSELPFDRHAYSRYKYGDTRQAAILGEQLSDGFLTRHGDDLLSSDQEFLGISSPRGIVPPAAYFIFKTFLENVNRFFQSHQRKPILEHTIQRLGTLAEDYSMLSRHERLERLIDERYFIDRQPIGTKTLIFVDDIRITGMHELNIIRLLENSQIRNRRYFLYYAQLTNDQIPPSIEHELNHSAIESLDQIRAIIEDPISNFQINTRVLKEILRADFTELDRFIHSISFELMQEIYHACLASHYQSIECFVERLQFFESHLKQRENQENSS